MMENQDEVRFVAKNSFYCIKLHRFLVKFKQVFEDALEEAVAIPTKQKSGGSRKFSRFRKKTESKLANDALLDISLDESLEAAREAVDKFLNNKFDEARDIVEPL